MHASREDVDGGGLMSYRAYETDSYRCVAIYVDKILTGAKPSDLPIEQADQIRTGDRSQDGEADRSDDSAARAGASGYSHQVGDAMA